MVGNKEPSDFITKQPGLTARVTSKKDPVPRLSPSRKYFPTYQEYWLREGFPQTKRVRVCGKSNRGGCNFGLSYIQSSKADHGDYYGSVMGMS